MRFKIRYRFWNVFFVVLAVLILFVCLAVISHVLFPNKEATKEISSVPTRTYIIRFGSNFMFTVFFFYFKFIITILMACVAYDVLLFYFLPEAMENRNRSLLFLAYTMIMYLSIFF